MFNMRQGVTRKSSAIRHNDNLHHVDAKIVWPYDYMIGRLNGEFPPPIDPLLYRHNKNGKKILWIPFIIMMAMMIIIIPKK
jgi:hypothetical protein